MAGLVTDHPFHYDDLRREAGREQNRERRALCADRRRSEIPARDMSWRDDALCRVEGCPLDLFFPERGDGEGVRAAKAVCARCRVVAACLDDAVRFKEPGIRGGESEEARRKLRRAARGEGQD